MVIENFFIHYKKPAQYLYWGENYLDFFSTPGPGKGLKKIKSFDNIPLLDVSPHQFQTIARELPTLPSGLLLNSTHFIFNIFEFEKLPLQDHLKKDLVEWRLKKVFPENITDYEHHFHCLTPKRVLSILLKKSIKEKIQQLFQDNKIPLIFFGNSTIEIINNMAKQGKSAPDFFIENDQHISIIVFQERGLPYYLRKFRSDHTEDLVDEVLKTSKYVQNNYAKTPATFSIAADRTHSDLNLPLLREELAKLQLQHREAKDKEQLFFAGLK